MNKIVELAIKNANYKLAKKQAGDRLKQIINTIKNGVTNTVKNPNFQKGAGNAIIGTGAGLGTYMGSRALGNDKKRAAKHGVLAGTAVAGGKTLYDYKDQLKNKFTELFKGKKPNITFVKGTNNGVGPVSKNAPKYVGDQKPKGTHVPGMKKENGLLIPENPFEGLTGK
jgi:hypothetical protein